MKSLLNGIPKSDISILLFFAFVKFTIHWLTNGQYGFHRDELYYIVGGFHPDFGYVDHPPITPLLARLSVSLFGLSISGLRLFPGLAGACIVLLTGVMARQLGGKRFAQVLAMLCAIFAPIFLATNTLFQTVSFDQLVWVVATVLLIQLIKSGEQRLWLFIGVVLGVGLQVKHTVLIYGFGLITAFLFTHNRRQLLSIWPWLGGIVALFLFLPNLLWQYINGWPTVEFILNNNANVRSNASALEFLLLQILFLGVSTFPIAVMGFVHFFRPRNKSIRLLAWLPISILALLLLIGGKPYYPAPLYPLLFAGGAVAIAESMQQRGWETRRPILVAIISLIALITLPLSLPILPPTTFVKYQTYFPHDDYAEMFGWPELVDTVSQVYTKLPPEDQQKTAIVTSNYGSAAAIELFGTSKGLPRPFSGHNSYFFWEPDDTPVEVVITVGFTREELASNFADIKEVAVISNRFGVENQESGRPVYLCRHPKLSLQEAWPLMKHFN